MTIGNSIPQGMGQCTVTGKIVPEDELITIQGQRVCAEGKAILLERLRGGEALPGELEKPSVGQRFGAILLDVIIVSVPFAIVNALLVSNRRQTAEAGAIALVSTVVSILYFGLMHAKRGQTVGKMAAKLVVVNNVDSSPITTQQAFIRALAYAGTGFVTGIANITGIAGVVIAASVIVAIWGFADLLLALFDRTRQRSLHDRLAGTRVVRKT